MFWYRMLWRILLLLVFVECVWSQEYYGKRIGSLSELAHGVKGEVYAPSEDTIYIKGLSYDGAGPDAYFWVGKTEKPDTSGIIVPDELGRTIKLSPYTNQNVLLKLPNNMKLRDIKWFAVWCRRFAALFGSIDIPFNLDPPKPLNLGALPNYAHATSARSVTIKDIKTLEIKGLRYDGSAPDAFFLVGKGNSPHANVIKVPDEAGRLQKIHGYQGEDITLRLPEGTTVFDIDWFGLFCITYRQDFGHVKVPRRDALNIPADLQTLASTVSPLMNCETVFPDKMQVSWIVREPDMFIQLEGRVKPNQYMSFGTSGANNQSQMVGADVTVVYYDPILQTAKVSDYILTSKAQCAPQAQPHPSGACPDTYYDGGRDDSFIVSWSYNDGVLKVLHKRALSTQDIADSPSIDVNQPVTLVAAMGNLNGKKEAAYHNIAVTGRFDPLLHWTLNRNEMRRNCDGFLQSASTNPRQTLVRGWEQAELRDVTKFRVIIGPAGGTRSYTAITGSQSWGIAYWVNNELIPVIHVKRNVTYLFEIEAGNDPQNQPKYHPMYITNNPEGGAGQNVSVLKSPDHHVYAGIIFRNGIADPSPGAGRYCELKHKTVDQAENVRSLDEYKRTIREDCEPGQPAQFYWTPDEHTPSVVYYQCFTHRNLGWKIVVDGSHYIKPSIAMLFIVFMLSTFFIN